MIHLKQYFYNPVCLNCGSLFVEVHLLCEACFQKNISPLLSFKKRTLSFDMKINNHYYLFDWVPGESDLLSKMVYAMKSDKGIRAIHFYTEILIQLMLEVIDYNDLKSMALLPLAGSRQSSTHSFWMAKKISTELRLSYFDFFKKLQKSPEQKSKSLEEREKNDFSLKSTPYAIEQITQFNESFLKALFVDDILTTGNSFKQSKILLNKNLQADIITLFYRNKVHET